ncbi:hypothetical protein [Azospirillum sp. SYSU D00513]|uniref:hypothetical protein n=1 Tax=Azospirillum sp. SYSU D00513 TaxID=2812561 RepID=UPI001A978FFE|nr:hypothetical protein [Azospirillum sp. SYSU D00513]
MNASATPGPTSAPAIDGAKLLRSLVERTDWPVASNILRYHGLRLGRGAKGTIFKLREMIANGAIGQADLRRLFVRYKENLAYGDKYVRFYDIGDASWPQIKAYADSARAEVGPFSASFPYMLTESELSNIAPNNPVLSAVERSPLGITLYYCSNRVHFVREKINTYEMEERISEAFKKYDEVIGVKVSKKQAVDVIWIPNDGGPIEIRVDANACPIVETSMAAHEILRINFNEAVGLNVLNKAVNLFPAIQNIYINDEDCRVTEMAFMAGTGSHKHETMRKSQTCLRKERFHEAGVGALEGDIRAHLITVFWEYEINSDFSSYPELKIQGHFRLIDHTEPELHDALIRRSWGAADYGMVTFRLLSNLAPNDGT